jgi:Tn3 transposase DDE domain
LHALRRFLFFAHQGQVRRGQPEDQANQASCLNLVIGLDQNGKWPGPDAANSSGADEVPPVSRQGLTYEDSCDATW